MRLLLLPDRIGLPVDGAALELPLGEDDRAGRPEGDYAVLAPGARTKARRWSPEAFAAVGDALAGRGLQVVVTGSEQDAPVTAEVASAMSSAATDMGGQTTLGSFGGLVEGARLVITNDTGASHVAAALRTPSVVVYTASDPRRWAPLDGALHRTVTAPVIRPELVLAEVERLLDA
jgi:ADP-heptose:LPS heptosyltransferase